MFKILKRSVSVDDMNKLIRKLKRFIFGKPQPRFPSLVELIYKYSEGIENWDEKYVSRKDNFRLLSNVWFLVNSKYPDTKILKRGEIGANVYSKTRYILK